LATFLRLLVQLQICIAGRQAGWFLGRSVARLGIPDHLLGERFKSGVRMYEVHNRGPLYDLGFFMGISAAVGGGGSSASRIAGQ